MQDFLHEQVINGTFGEVWVDNDYMAEATALQATIKLDTKEVAKTRTLKKGYKVTGITGSGTLKMNKVSSYFLKKMSDSLKQGKSVRATIISNVEDPEALGAERVKLNDCLFTELDVINWEANTLGEESIPFSFSDWEVLESIDV